MLRSLGRLGQPRMKAGAAREAEAAEEAGVAREAKAEAARKSRAAGEARVAREAKGGDGSWGWHSHTKW